MPILRFGFDDVVEHAYMVLDRERVSRFATAIESIVTPRDVVADVGSGSGVLSLLAARAGARKVYAIERSVIAELITEHARSNGFDSVIEVIRDDVRNVRLAEP